jgi:uncharacterized protein (TIGR03086 family)
MPFRAGLPNLATDQHTDATRKHGDATRKHAGHAARRVCAIHQGERRTRVMIMDLQPMMEKAARAAIEVVRNVKQDQLTLPTPCSDWDVRMLANHLTFWSAFRSEVAARKQTPPAGQESDVDYVTDDWAQVFERQLNRAVAAWAEPGAWEGVTGLAGGESPAPFIGKMMIGELVAHGWDLARATGQELTVDADLAEVVYQGVVEFAEQGREYHIFGEPVPVPDSASTLEKALALSGRDPNWSP